MIEKNTLILKLIKILIFLLPFHTLLIYNILSKYIPGINYWKEIVIILLFLLVMNKKRFSKQDSVFILSVLLFIVYITTLFLISPTIFGLYGIRNYIEPLILLIIVSKIHITEKYFNDIVMLSIKVAVFISVWGIFQQIFIGDKFLIDLGYSMSEKYPYLLHHSHYIAGGFIQRNIGTFSHANIFGLYLSIQIILLLKYKSLFDKKIFYLFLLVLTISLLVTFSRSAMLASFIVILLFYIKYIKYFFILFIFMIIFLLYSESDIALTILAMINLTSSGSDPSIGGHMDSFIFSLDLIEKNWFTGIGIGSVGPKAFQYTGVLIDVESSFFALIIDLGLTGFILYITILVTFLNRTINFKILLVLSITWIFLPLIYELEITLIIFLILGLSKSNKRKTQNENNISTSFQR